ncbi:hypothetical protein HID58_079838, partial [Brassica napus]
YLAEDTVMKVRDDSKEWFDAQKLELSRSVTLDHNSESLSRWEAPKEGFVKCNALEKINEWSLSGASVRLNRCATKVADSLTMEMRYQSYVARGVPGWLCDMLEDDKQGR